jgi:hypothetical protein
MHRLEVALIAALALLATACARNAVLEVELELPPQPAAGEPRYAVVQFESQPRSFEEDWRGANDHAGTALAAEPVSVAYSVIAEDPSTVVQVKVLFCTTPDCSAIDDAPDRVPGLWYRLERSLYVGERTRWRQTIAAVPTDPPAATIEVDKCEVEGCIRAGASETTFCRLSGAHYCE